MTLHEKHEEDHEECVGAFTRCHIGGKGRRLVKRTGGVVGCPVSCRDTAVFSPEKSGILSNGVHFRMFSL